MPEPDTLQHHSRLIFKTPGNYEAFSRLASRKGLELVHEARHGDRSPVAYQKVLANIDSTVHVQYIDDGLAMLSYLDIAGPRAEPYIRVFSEAFAFLSLAEMLSDWDSATLVDDKIDAIVRLGISAYSQPPEQFMSRIGAALDDDEPAVRDAGLVAFSYSPWEPLAERIQHLRDHDADAKVRHRARLLLNAWTPATRA
jgi:hypothetical protein